MSLVVLASASCRSDSPKAGPSTTSAATTPTTIPVVVTLPADGLARTPPVPATADFETVGPQSTIDGLLGNVVATVEALHPGEGESRLRTESASSTAGTTGIVLVRRTGLGDDSLAGYDYRVTARLGAGGWVVESATQATICRRGVAGDLCV